MISLPKYGTPFLVFIIIAKITYLAVEVFYNGHLLDVITRVDITQEMLESLESLGHNVTSVGLTLLVTPLFYLLFKKIFKGAFVRSIFVLVMMAVAFVSFHTMLVSLMDKILYENKDKRYTSYYITAFKYGMLHNYFGYESFIPKENLQNLTTEDRIILSNVFLLNYIDETLIDNIIEKGKDSFADIFILQYGIEEFRESETEFNSKVKQIMDAYNSYIDKSKKINSEFSKLDSKAVMEAEYQDFTGTLRSKYADYEKEVIKYEKSIDISDKKMEKTYDDLYQYFKYQNRSKAQREYKAAMNRQFGYYIEPKRWCAKYNCPDVGSIRRVVQEEAYKKFKKKSGGIPPNLSQKEFYNHPVVKKKVVDELRNKGLRVPENFNYSKEQFANAYKGKVNKEFKNVKNKFVNEFKNKTGKNITFGLTYNQFVYKFNSGDIVKKYGKKYGDRLYKMVLKKDTSGFYEEFYKPYFKGQYLEGYLLSKKDFEGDKNKELGDNAIKHLYIPPFAIGMSLLAGILNLVSVIAIIIFLVVKLDAMDSKRQLLIKSAVKTVLLLLLIVYPFTQMEKSALTDRYKALEKVKEHENGKAYLKILEWIIIYEKLSYEKLYSNIKSVAQ